MQYLFDEVQSLNLLYLNHITIVTQQNLAMCVGSGQWACFIVSINILLIDSIKT